MNETVESVVKQFECGPVQADGFRVDSERWNRDFERRLVSIVERCAGPVYRVPWMDDVREKAAACLDILSRNDAY